MVGIGRNTLYRHIEEKGISLDSEGKIDVSELIRVYGNENVKTPEQAKHTLQNKSAEHDGTQPNPVLEAELTRLKADLENLNQERRRERDQLNGQIEHLKASLDKSMSQNEGLTRLLSDQRTEAEKAAERKKSEEQKTLEKLLQTVEEMKNKKPAWKFWSRNG